MSDLSESGSIDSAAQNSVHLVSLGCARNRVDSEVMLGSLLDDGWAITDDIAAANAIVINTCGFIESAKKESIDTILEAASYKEEGVGRAHKLIVAGCLTQRYKTQLAKGLPEVDLFIGTDEFPSIAKFLKEPEDTKSKGPVVRAKRSNYLYSGELPKKNTLTSSSAYVKVAEGCQHKCAFCIIPAIRGPLRSRPVASVVSEVENLVGSGVKEVNLIAQDLAAYGRDTGQSSLLELLQPLVEITGLEWIRLLYVYPENIQDDFLDFWAQNTKIVPYIDIPVQHGADDVLKRMSRDVSREQILRTIEKVRKRIPNVAIRTTVMVGFPGETAEDFAELLSLVDQAEFDHLGCFSYSQEEGTVAGRMKDQIAESVKQERLAVVMAKQAEISRRRLAKYKGQVVDVLVKGLSDESDMLFEGRMPQQAPEVDGVVYINDGQVIPGTIQKVRITDTHDYDLVGEVIR